MRRRTATFLLIFGITFGGAVTGKNLLADPGTQQVASNSGSSSATFQSLLQAYQAEQKSLSQELNVLTAQGAGQQRIAAWTQQHAAELAAQKQRAQAITVITGLQLSRVVQKMPAPANASQTLTDFLAARTTLQNASARIHNQLVAQALSSGTTPTLASLGQMQHEEELIFQQQNAATLALQRQRSGTIANESAAKLLSVPAVVTVPANVTPEMAAFMRTRNQIRRALAQLQNQYAEAGPAARIAAIAAWRQQNAALLTQMRQQAQNLVPSTSN